MRNAEEMTRLPKVVRSYRGFGDCRPHSDTISVPQESMSPKTSLTIERIAI